MSEPDPLPRNEQLRRAEFLKRLLQKGLWSPRVDREITQLNKIIAELKEEPQ